MPIARRGEAPAITPPIYMIGLGAMSLAEVLPEVQTLSRLDKIRLIQVLAQELEQDESVLIEPGRSYPV